MKMFLLNVLLISSVASQVNIKSVDDGIEVLQRDPNKGNDEIFTSMHELGTFFQKEKEYVDDIRAILEKKLVIEQAAQNLRDYVSSFEDVLGNQEDDETFLENPLNVYHLIRHVAVGWAVVNNTLSQEKLRVGKMQNLPKRVRRVLSRPKRDHVPSEKDLDGAAVAIVRLHDYYKFNVSRFVNEGVFATDDYQVESNGDLTVWDAFKIGVKGANKMFLGSGLDIMISALTKAQSDGVSVPPFIPPMDLTTLKNLVKTARTVHDQKLDRWGARTMTHSTNDVPYDKRLAKKKKFTKTKGEFLPILNDVRIATSGKEKEQYIRLCRGEDLRPLNVTKDLFCYYADRNKPFYRYGPRKVEVMSLEPRIVVIHEFITDSEASEIIAFAAPKLRRSEVSGKVNDTLDDGRISEQTWAIESECPAAAKLTKRIDYFLDLESLSQEHAELYQVANYGLGGLYTVHYDQVMMDKDLRQTRNIFNVLAGDRMATIMGYLTDVLAGGYTVFPLVGAGVPPRKGSVVLWWNMDQAGGYDDMTRHGGCPVMIGNKWITNKWIRSNSQMFKRPCPKLSFREIRDIRTKNVYRKGPRYSEP